MRRHVAVDGKVRTDMNFPVGLMDVLSIKKTEENFRLLWDTKGRFVLQRISPEEAKFKLCRVMKFAKGKKSSIGSNPFLSGQAKAIPYIVTHDGRTIKYPDPNVAVNDTVRLDLETGTITGLIKFDIGAQAMITRGKNIGVIGTMVSRDKHPGSFEMVSIRDKRGQVFSTRLANVFAIGDDSTWITIPRGKGVKLTIEENRDLLLKKNKK